MFHEMDRVDHGSWYNVQCTYAGTTYVQNFCSRIEIRNNLCCYFDVGVIYIAVMRCACKYTFEYYMCVYIICDLVACLCFEFDIIVIHIKASHQYCCLLIMFVTHKYMRHTLRFFVRLYAFIGLWKPFCQVNKS